MRFLFGLILMFVPIVAYADMLGDVEAAVIEKNYTQGKDLATKILKETANSTVRINAEYYLGLCQLRLGQFAPARKAFSIVMSASLNQDLYEKATLGLIEGLYMEGFYNDALKECKKLLSKYPNSSSKSLIYLKIARASLKLMKWDDARSFLNKIIGEYPQSFEAPIAKGLLEEKEFFAVQVGAFLEKEKAMSLVEELKSKKEYVYIVETTGSDGKMFYRVRVGQISSLDQAQNVQTKLSRQGYPSLIYP